MCNYIGIRLFSGNGTSQGSLDLTQRLCVCWTSAGVFSVATCNDKEEQDLSGNLKKRRVTEGTSGLTLFWSDRFGTDVICSPSQSSFKHELI